MSIKKIVEQLDIYLSSVQDVNEKKRCIEDIIHYLENYIEKLKIHIAHSKIQFWLIDDSEVVNLVNEKTIEHMIDNAYVTVFNDANLVLEKLSNNIIPDIILLDINMPKLSGMEFLHRYQELNVSCNIVMLFSDFITNEQNYINIVKDVKAVINKPLSQEKIKKYILPLLDNC